MMNNSLWKVWNQVKQFLLYEPPRTLPPFVLDEKRPHDKPSALSPDKQIHELLKQLEERNNYAARFARFMEKCIVALRQGKWESINHLARDLSEFEKQYDNLPPIHPPAKLNAPGYYQLSLDIRENQKTMEALYSMPDNKDIVIRPFDLPCSPPVKAMLIYIDGMIDKQIVNLALLQPLMLFIGGKKPAANLAQTLVDEYLPSNQAKLSHKLTEIIDSINSGDSALFLDGSAQVILLDTKGYPHRGIERTFIEQTVQGSQAAFSEVLRVNTSLIRTGLQTNDLITELLEVGDRVPRQCAIIYLKTLANPELVSEIKRRIKGLTLDYIENTGTLMQMIEDHPYTPFPQTLSTERPDKVAANLLEGRVGILLEGNPFAHIVPAHVYSFIHSPEDWSLKFLNANFMRLLRLLAVFISLLLPSLYLSINYFHQEALPTELVLAVAGARDKVPFPAIFEIIIMELSFELVREAGLRIPGMLGSTIGIVGAIILGQAAVSASLVSPIMVVIIAVTGLASFSIADYRFSFALRVSRFIFLILSAMFGLVGLALALVLLGVHLCNTKSFGMPYLAPIVPKTIAGNDVIVRGPVFRQENRPDEINALQPERQTSFIRKWKRKKPLKEEL